MIFLVYSMLMFVSKYNRSDKLWYKNKYKQIIQVHNDTHK